MRERREYKIGDPLIIKDSHKNDHWYTNDVYYVIGFIPKGSRVNGKEAIYELLRTSTLNGREFIAHETKFVLAIEHARDEKLKQIGI